MLFVPFNDLYLIILKQMLQKHADTCREEDDSNNILSNVASYDSEEEEEDEDDPLLNAEGLWLCIKQDYLFTFTIQRILQSIYIPRFGF